jgi:hypothetical protein
VAVGHSIYFSGTPPARSLPAVPLTVSYTSPGHEV